VRPKLVVKYQVYLTTPVVEINLRTPAVVHLSHIRLGHRRCDTIRPTIDVSTIEVTPSQTLSRAAGVHRHSVRHEYSPVALSPHHGQAVRSPRRACVHRQYPVCTRERLSIRERGREQPSVGRYDNGNQQDAHLLECQGGLRAWKLGASREDAVRFSQRALQAL